MANLPQDATQAILQINQQVQNLQAQFDAAAHAAAAANPPIAPVPMGIRFRGIQFAEFDAEGKNPEVDFETWEQ